MISDEIIQAAILAKVKTFTTVTERLAEGANGVKEFQWQGDTFKYPAVRLDLEDNAFAFSELKLQGARKEHFLSLNISNALIL
jgi:hypothetical protein